jgi:hypothetical protein
MQQRIEAEVRRLLRRAGNPFLLGSCPLAQALCESTGIANPRSALRHAIDGAFAQAPRELRLRQMLVSAIENGGVSALGGGFEVSKRHLQRRRAKAVAILASHIRGIIGVPQLVITEDEGPAADPLDTIAELIAGIEPGLASQLQELKDPNGATASPALAAVRHEQAAEIDGAQVAAAEELWPNFGRFDRDGADTPETRFELEWLAFLRARHRSDARSMDAIARNLKRLALDRASWLMRALLARANAKICCGLLEEAAELFDEIDRRGIRNFAVIDLAWSGALRGEHLLQQGDDVSAERLASGSFLILRGRHFAAPQCQATIARARLRMGRAWSCEDGDLHGSAWGGLLLAVERARHSIAAGDSAGAEALARNVYEAALARGYDGVAARAAAVLGEPLLALSHLLVSRDRSVACDLFPFDQNTAGSSLLADRDAAIVELVHTALVAAIPQLRTPSARETAAARTFLCGLYAYALGAPRARDFDESISQLDSSAPSFAQYLRHFSDDAFDILQTLVTAIVPTPRRADAEHRLRLAARAVVMLIEPRGNPRHFVVG